MAAEEVPIRVLARRALLCVDKRSLGLGRIALGLVLLGDLVRRATSAGLWYADDGPLPASLFANGSGHLFSPMLLAPAAIVVWISFVAAAIFDLAVLVGYRTKLFQALAFVALVSLQSRVRPLQNGGDRSLCLLCFWTLFLPMGARFSLDARRLPRDDAPACSLAYLAVLLQLAVAYFLNSVRKTSGPWADGSALSYILRDTTIASPFGMFVGEKAPTWFLWLLTRGTRSIEFIVPFLILTPLYATWARRLAIVLLVGLHVGIVVTLNVGVFSYAMMAFYPLLLTSEDWTQIEGWLRRRASPRVVAAWERLGSRRAQPAASSRLPASASRAVAWAREATVAFFLLATTHRVLADNRALGEHPATPAFLRAVIEYPHLYQIWGMFISEHPRAVTILVDAETADGRHVDPLIEAAAPDVHAGPPWTALPHDMNLDAFIFDYAFVVTKNPAFLPALEAWILRYPERTGRPGDRVVRFAVYRATATIPRRGSDVPPLLDLEPILQRPVGESPGPPRRESEPDPAVGW